MSKEEKRERMLSIVDEWRGSGLTQKVFCSLRGIKLSALCYWLSRSKESSQSSGGFVELSGTSLIGSTAIEIIYPSGVRLKVNGDLSLIARLIRL